ncbi:hypothetical protein [Natronorubrum sp. DTA7]|uniref:hypothetical protein n=1 Tax=Natronorubrum sp. DTA7 TaxID=3447016 RepID=UPI003F82DF8A
MSIALKQEMSTKISEQTNGRIRTTLPKATVEETGFHDLESDHQKTEVRIGCGGVDERPLLTVRFGPGVPDGPATTKPNVSSSTGQVLIEFPIFLAHAWGIVDCHAAWGDGSITTDDEGTVTVTAPIDGWDSDLEMDMWELAASETHRSTIQRVGEDVENTIAMLPMPAVREIGIERGGKTRVDPSFHCLEGRVVLVLSPTDATREEDKIGRSVVFAGPSNSQPRIAAGEIAAGLGGDAALERGESVPMRWVVRDGDLIGFVIEQDNSED